MKLIRDFARWYPPKIRTALPNWNQFSYPEALDDFAGVVEECRAKLGPLSNVFTKRDLEKKKPFELL